MLIKSKHIRRLFFLIILTVVGLFNQYYAQDCTSDIQITTNSDSALIIVNNKLVGKGNVNLELRKGDYEILIKASDDSWNAPYTLDSLFINDCGISKNLKYNLNQKVFIDSDPQDAAIIEDSNIVAYTPAWIPNSYNKIELNKQNYSNKEISLKELRANVHVSMDFTGVEKHDENFFESTWFKVLLGSAAALGAVTAYFKVKADNKYDEYLRTRDSSILDEVNRFDLYSGTAFTVLQLNFGYLIYRFLKAQ